MSEIEHDQLMAAMKSLHEDLKFTRMFVIDHNNTLKRLENKPKRSIMLQAAKATLFVVFVVAMFLILLLAYSHGAEAPLEPPPPPGPPPGQQCIVAAPPEPFAAVALNVRVAPNGPVLGTLFNGHPVTLTGLAWERWVVVDNGWGLIGWAFGPFLYCPPPSPWPLWGFW